MISLVQNARKYYNFVPLIALTCAYIPIILNFVLNVN